MYVSLVFTLIFTLVFTLVLYTVLNTVSCYYYSLSFLISSHFLTTNYFHPLPLFLSSHPLTFTLHPLYFSFKLFIHISCLYSITLYIILHSLISFTILSVTHHNTLLPCLSNICFHFFTLLPIIIFVSHHSIFTSLLPKSHFHPFQLPFLFLLPIHSDPYSIVFFLQNLSSYLIFLVFVLIFPYFSLSVAIKIFLAHHSIFRSHVFTCPFHISDPLTIGSICVVYK